MNEAEQELPPLREVIAAHGLAAKKSLGQHFLLDRNLTARIARSATRLEEGSTFEVGPGPGGLTRALLAAGAKQVVAIEKDRRCIDALSGLENAYPANLTVIEGDAMAADLTNLAPAPRRIVANLPYNVSTALLLKWLKDLAARPDSYRELILMFQKEVAVRLTASSGNRDYGRLSVITQWLCEARILFSVPARAFTPPPKVDSAVLHLIPRAQPLADAQMASLERVTAAGFGQRRKMLRQSLKSLGVDPKDLLSRAAVRDDLRAEDLSVQDFCALARTLDRQR